MKVKCLHGYFIFEETRSGQISDFISYSGLSLVPKDNYFTFEDLEDAPDFSLESGAFLDTIALETFEGKPWEVFEANGFVYDFGNGLVVPITSITQVVKINQIGSRFISSGLILPGSVTSDGSRVKDYAAWFSIDTLKWLYTEVNYV